MNIKFLITRKLIKKKVTSVIIFINMKFISKTVDNSFWTTADTVPTKATSNINKNILIGFGLNLYVNFWKNINWTTVEIKRLVKLEKYILLVKVNKKVNANTSIIPPDKLDNVCLNKIKYIIYKIYNLFFFY